MLNKLILLIALSSAIISTSLVQAQDEKTSSTSKTIKRELVFNGIEGDLLVNVMRNVELVGQQNQATDIKTTRWNQLSKRVTLQAKEALIPFGYYNTEVNLTIIPKGVTEIWQYQINLGEPVKIKNLEVVINGDANSDPFFDAWRNNLSLKVGEILVQPDYDRDKSSLLALANKIGYFDAQFSHNIISIDKQQKNANVSLVLESGTRYRYGEVTLNWPAVDSDSHINESLLEGFIKTVQGKPFVDDELLLTQRELTETGFFSNVEVRPLLDKKADGAVAIEVNLFPNKRKLYALSLGIGTDTGPRGSLGYENRRFNKKGHKIVANLGASTNEQNAVLSYRIPLHSSPSDSINLSAAYIDENSDSVQRQTSSLGAEVAKVYDNWQWNYGISYRDESFLQDGLDQSAQLLIPRLRWQGIKTDNLENPSRGWSASASIQGADTSVISDVSFLQLSISAKFLYPIGQGRFISRVELAGTQIDDPSELPVSLRFFAGGDTSIRGYRFESIGIDNGDNVDGARNLVVGSIEYEHPVINDFGIAAFIDFGDAFNNDIDIKRGAGLGLRWRLPFGAVRLDVASALDLEGQPLRAHFTFGTDL